MSKRRTSIVTGGAGFIGSHLCRRLLDNGNSVVCIDNLSTGRFKNIEPLLKRDGFTFIEHNVELPYDNEIPHDFEADGIFNLACKASPPHYQKNHIDTLNTCVLGAINVLKLAFRLKCPVLQASTSEVYGDPLVHPQTEAYWGNVNTVGLRSCYDEGKRCAESYFNAYNLMYGTPIRIVRIFNTYGPNMDPLDGRIVSNLIVQALRGDDLTIYGDGSQTRSFCYVDDLVRGLLLLMESDVTEPVNLGNPGEFTMLELAESVLRLTGSKSRIVHRPLPADDPKRRKPDISKAKSLLGWEPVVGLAAGLERTIEYFKGEIAQ